MPNRVSSKIAIVKSEESFLMSLLQTEEPFPMTWKEPVQQIASCAATDCMLCNNRLHSVQQHIASCAATDCILCSNRLHSVHQQNMQKTFSTRGRTQRNWCYIGGISNKIIDSISIENSSVCVISTKYNKIVAFVSIRNNWACGTDRKAKRNFVNWYLHGMLAVEIYSTSFR